MINCYKCGKELPGVELGYNSNWLCAKCHKNEADSLYCITGDKVIFKYPFNGDEYDRELARRYLAVDETYVVKSINIGSWCSYITLEAFPNVSFSSVLFDRVPQK